MILFRRIQKIAKRRADFPRSFYMKEQRNKIEFMIEGDIPEYLDGYSPSQLKIILEERKIKQVIAGAGSGKTRTVIGLVEHRLRQSLEKPGGILLLSFSRKAAGEIKERLAPNLREMVEVSTFHSFCFRHLRRLHPHFKSKPFGIMEDEDRLDVLKNLLEKEIQHIGGIPYTLLLEEENRFKARFPAVYERVMKGFHEYKITRNIYEYDDLITVMLKELEAGAPFLDELKNRYGLIIVDEFQDTDPSQLRFLKLMKPDRLMVVGDDWQAIYSFRGATVQPFLDFPEIFTGTTVYELGENYRSYGHITDLGGRVIRKSSRQLKKNVRAVRGNSGEPVYALRLDDDRIHKLSEILGELDYKILVRSNFRLKRWLRAGISEERVMTIHKSKGLEFPLILLDLAGGWTSSRLPDKPARQELDEEIRILYVGITRAKNSLIVLFDDRDGQTRESKYWKTMFRGNVREMNPDQLADRIRL